MKPFIANNTRVIGQVFAGELKATIMNSTFDGCNFNAVSFINSNIGDSIFRNCSFVGTRMEKTIFHDNVVEGRIGFQLGHNVTIVNCMFNGKKDVSEDFFKKLIELMP